MLPCNHRVSREQLLGSARTGRSLFLLAALHQWIARGTCHVRAATLCSSGCPRQCAATRVKAARRKVVVACPLLAGSLLRRQLWPRSCRM